MYAAPPVHSAASVSFRCLAVPSRLLASRVTDPAVYDENQCLSLHELSVDQLILYQWLFNGSVTPVNPGTLLETYGGAIDANLAKPGCFAEILAMTWGSYPNVSVCGGHDFCEDVVPVYSYSYGAQ